MAAVIESFGALQSRLDEARSTLRGFDENLKRLIGRDPSESAPRPPQKRGLNAEDNRRRNRRNNHENDEPPLKRRGNASVFKRLSDRPVNNEYEEEVPQRQMISKVIVTPKEVPSRQEALAAQSTDEKFKARNRRMFGALLGTLQKFQQEETKLKPREDKRAQLEKKIEEHEIREKAEIRKERQELFLNRKRKQAEIKMIELKMLRMKEYNAWEEKQKPRMSVISTKAKPMICYLPRKLNDANKIALEESKKEIERIIEKRREAVFDELKAIEDRMKKNLNLKMKDGNHEESFEAAEPANEEEAKDNNEEVHENGAKSEVKSEISEVERTTEDVQNGGTNEDSIAEDKPEETKEVTEEEDENIKATDTANRSEQLEDSKV